jgi:hypothetical protein
MKHTIDDCLRAIYEAAIEQKMNDIAIEDLITTTDYKTIMKRMFFAYCEHNPYYSSEELRMKFKASEFCDWCKEQRKNGIFMTVEDETLVFDYIADLPEEEIYRWCIYDLPQYIK